MRIGRISKKTAATLGNRSGMSDDASELFSKIIYYIANDRRDEALRMLADTPNEEFKVPSPERLKLLDFAEHVANTCVPLLISSLKSPMEFHRVARRLFTGKIDFSGVGWDVYWYLQLLFRSDGMVDCYVQASSIIASRYVACVKKEDWMKTWMVPYVFYAPAKDGEALRFPGGKMKFEEGFTHSYLEATDEMVKRA